MSGRYGRTMKRKGKGRRIAQATGKSLLGIRQATTDELAWALDRFRKTPPMVSGGEPGASTPVPPMPPSPPTGKNTPPTRLAAADL